jgi:DNA-binding response OmpR family regulator
MFIMRSTILFVDHDIKLTDAVARALTGRGHNIRACTNALECVQTLHEFAPTVLVLDRELLWGGAEGVLEYLIRDEPLMPPMVVVATNDDGTSLPDHLEPWVDLQIVRPNSLPDLLPFLNQLETLAWWSQSPYRELSPSSSKKNGTNLPKGAETHLALPGRDIAPDRQQVELYPSH